MAIRGWGIDDGGRPANERLRRRWGKDNALQSESLESAVSDGQKLMVETSGRCVWIPDISSEWIGDQCHEMAVMRETMDDT